MFYSSVFNLINIFHFKKIKERTGQFLCSLKTNVSKYLITLYTFQHPYNCPNTLDFLLKTFFATKLTIYRSIDEYVLWIPNKLLFTTVYSSPKLPLCNVVFSTLEMCTRNIDTHIFSVLTRQKPEYWPNEWWNGCDSKLNEVQPEKHYKWCK